MVSPQDFWRELDALGEETVRLRLAQNVWDRDRKVPLVNEWLARKERERAEAAARERDHRERAALDLAREANRIAQQANVYAQDANRIAGRSNRIAWIAVLISVASVVLSLVGCP